MTPKVLTKPEKPVAEEQPRDACVHHWVIEPPTSPLSKGICKICGAEKEFYNEYRQRSEPGW